MIILQEQYLHYHELNVQPYIDCTPFSRYHDLKLTWEGCIYAREKAPFEAEFPLVRENLIEDKSTGTFVM